MSKGSLPVTPPKGATGAHAAAHRPALQQPAEITVRSAEDARQREAEAEASRPEPARPPDSAGLPLLADAAPLPPRPDAKREATPDAHGDKRARHM